MYVDYYLYYLSYFSSLFFGYPLVIRLTAVVVLVLVAITIFGLSRLLYIGYKINRDDKRRRKAIAQFDGKLSFVIQNDMNYEIEEIQELLQYDSTKAKQWNLEVLTEVVLNVKRAVHKNGNFNEINYKNCLEVFRLKPFWEKKMRTADQYQRKEALQVIGDIDNGVNTGALSKSTFHRNNDLRKAARGLYTSQDNYNPFRFMEENFDENFTDLDKLRLHGTLVKRNSEGKLPNLLRWISNSKNSNYIVFIIREIGFFKQNDACPILLQMLDKQERKEVRRQIVLTLGELDYYQCAPDLIDRFSLESTAVQLAIINAMGKMHGKQAIGFLKDAYRLAVDENRKITVARAIKLHGAEGELILHRFQEEATGRHQISEQNLLKQVFSEKAVVSF